MCVSMCPDKSSETYLQYNLLYYYNLAWYVDITTAVCKTVP